MAKKKTPKKKSKESTFSKFGKYLKKETKKGFKASVKAGKKGYASGKKGVTQGLDLADKLTIGVEKADSGFSIGHKMTVTNGMYSGQPVIITSFIKGGIKAKLSNGQIINLRHGSFKDYYMTGKKKMVVKKGNIPKVNKLERYY